MTPEHAVLNSVLICAAGAVLTLLVSKSRSLAGLLAFVTTAATAVLILPAVAQVLTAGAPHHPETLWNVGGFALRFYVDGLSAIFLALAVLIAVLAALFSIVHMQRYQKHSVAMYYPNLLLFIGGMYGVLSTTDMMWFFCGFWQLMTLPSFLLVRFESELPQNRAAALKYLVMMEAACVAAMIGGGLIAGHAHDPSLTYDFDTVSEGLPALLKTNPGALTGCLAAFLVGFGIKVGMWPFGQLWVPGAYSAAPSPASSLISGVMSKTGVYGLMRTFLWLVPLEAREFYHIENWAILVSILGTITLFTGTMQGLRQDDAKRMLAFSSIGQIGYILLSLGTCMALVNSGNPTLLSLACIGFMGALLHALNHGIFKGLLFFNAGSMIHATGSQDLNKMGGLWKYMPLTGLTVLIASFGIAGVPLLNGFVSKWSIYVAAVQGSGNGRYLAVCAIIAILTSAMTLAMYIKFFGTAFLSRTSALVKEQASKGKLEVGITMQLPQVLLAVACIAIGLAPAGAFQVLAQVLKSSPQSFGKVLADAATGSAAPFAAGMPGLDAVSGKALYFPLTILAVLAIAFFIAFVISKLGGGARRTAAPWLCGYAQEADCFRYAASNFYGEITRLFGWLGGLPPTQSRNPGASRED